MAKITVSESLIRATLKVLTLGSDASRGSRLAMSLETLGAEIDVWAASGDGLQTLVDTEKLTGVTVSDALVKAAMLCAAHRNEAALGTALRNSLEYLAIELDTWATEGSRKRRGRDSRVVPTPKPSGGHSRKHER